MPSNIYIEYLFDIHCKFNTKFINNTIFSTFFFHPQKKSGANPKASTRDIVSCEWLLEQHRSKLREVDSPVTPDVALAALTIGVGELDRIHILHHIEVALIEEVGVTASDPIELEAIVALCLE